MRKSFLAGVLLALAAPVAAQMVSGAARPTNVPCADLKSVFATAPAGATLLVSGTCEDIELRDRTAPIAIRASGGNAPLVIKGLRLVRVENLTWTGGRIEAIAGHASSNHILGRGLSITRGRNLLFDGVHFSMAHRGVVAGQTQGLTIQNSRFTQMRSDGLNLVSVVGGNIVGNEFGPTSPRPTECRLPDGSILYRLSRGICEKTHFGTWRDGDHADCIQIWGTPTDVRVERNRIYAPNPGWCQGITTHGIDRGTRLQFVNNTVYTDHGTGISMNKCDDCEIRDNLIDKASENPLHQVGLNLGEDLPGLVACGNVQPHRKWRPVGTEPCAF
jgi:hypothetical protein